MQLRYLAGRRDLLAPAALFPDRYPCLLESVVRGTPQSRFDILFAYPGASFTQHADGRVIDHHGVSHDEDFLAVLDRAWQAERAAPSEDGLPFHGGWVLMLAYELAGRIEPRLHLRPHDVLPVAVALRCSAAVIVDHERDCTIVLAEEDPAQLDALELDLSVAWMASPLPSPGELIEDPPRHFLDGVARIHEHLQAGDIFQVNLSRAWEARYREPVRAGDVYAALRQANPAPFSGLFQHAGWALASSSPERLVEVRGGVAQTRPIAGTRPRVADDDDTARIRELTTHPKERAEHVMLIDLERNDLGRVCAPGTVEVDELMVVESYAHVHHIVSNVRGCLRKGTTPGEVIAATFPGGTITGCPKVRCMEIIAALEDAPRGAYTGALGYLDRNGDLDLNILIRTLTLADNRIGLRAGAGIVADSVAVAELEETRAKARGLLRTLGIGT
ncbi:aminodeoxychorismate synthase component I [Dyella sp.]|uniref:aminodeoxychorismate synthase component I n=1 Tax=Dyella sp. TaxID=1869338 RepID=UPI002ED4A63D